VLYIIFWGFVVVVFVIEIEGLCKIYCCCGCFFECVFDGFDLLVEVGGVYGFLGFNGLGKIIMIWVLFGLVVVDGGMVCVFGYLVL